MTLRRLVLRNVLRRPVRSGLLVAFTTLSAFLACFLASILTTLDDAIKSANARRLTVQSAVSFFGELPSSYRETVADVPGVESVNRWSWFGGVYKDEKNFFPRMAVDFDVLFAQYPEIAVTDEERRAVLADRRGCLIGIGLADQFGIRVGDVVPIIGTTYTPPRGGAWEFTVRGIYHARESVLNEKILFLHWDYLEEARRAMTGYEGLASRVTLLMVRVREGFDATRVAAAIDARYDSGPVRTHTQTEAAFRAERIRTFGNVTTLLGWIGAAILFAVILSAGNAMGMAAAERSRENGILKALGFSNRISALLTIIESAVLTGLGGGIGGLLARASGPGIRRLLSDYLPIFQVRWETAGIAFLASVVLGILSALIPAWQVARLSPIAALRRGE